MPKDSTVPQPYEDRPNTIPWPPILYVCAAGLAVGLWYIAPIAGLLPFQSTLINLVLGLAISGGGLGLIVWAIRVMSSQNANIMPNRAATRLVADGPFKYSRNPIYLGDTILLVGLAFLFSNPWFFPAAFLAAVFTHHLVIHREEKHLAARFPADWERYCGSVPRWIGWL